MAAKKKRPKQVAVVHCNGGTRAKKKIEYSCTDCNEAAAVCEGGPLECAEGCLGCGTCVEACRLKAIHINDFGVAQVDPEKSVGCGLCIEKCPRGVIGLHRPDCRIVPLCSNTQKGIDPKTKTGAKTACDVSCIACGLCVKKCPADAIHLEDFHAVIDENECLSCGFCAVSCPRGVIADMLGILTPAR